MVRKKISVNSGPTGENFPRWFAPVLVFLPNHIEVVRANRVPENAIVL